MQNLFSLIGTFLETPAKSETPDGWPPVTIEEMEMLKIIVQQLLDKKYPGGKVPIDVVFTDTSKFERLGVDLLIPKNPTNDDLLAVSNSLNRLTRDATNKMDFILNLLNKENEKDE